MISLSLLVLKCLKILCIFVISSSMGKEMAIIWNTDKPVLDFWKSGSSFNELCQRSEVLYRISSDYHICVILDNMNLELSEDNYSAIFHLNSPVLLDVLEKNLQENEESEEDEERAQKPNLNATVQNTDLSKMGNSFSASGSRWTDLEKAYLKNFFKFITKRGLKVDYNSFALWIQRRKTSQERLFGDRSSNAILSHYRQMISKGEMNNLVK